MHDAWDQFMPAPVALTPAGIEARMEVAEFPVASLVPVQHSPDTGFMPGVPLPGPPAVTNVFVDYDSMRWWGREGSGQAVWSQGVVLSADLPPALPESLLQHIDVWQTFAGGYPSIARNRPMAFGDQVATFNPNLR